MKLRYVHDILDTFLTHVLDTCSPSVRAICDFVLSVTVVILFRCFKNAYCKSEDPRDLTMKTTKNKKVKKNVSIFWCLFLPPSLFSLPPSHPLSPFFLLACFCFLWCTSNAGCAVESISYIWTYLFLTGEKKKAERLQKLLDVSKVLISILLNSFGKHQYPSPQWVLTHEIWTLAGVD